MVFVPGELGGWLMRPYRSLRVAQREILALARHVALLPLDVEERLPSGARAGDDVAVLVHGLFSTAGVLRPLREELARAPGVHCASFSYASGPGVEALSRRLARFVRQLPQGVRVHLVGHSLGGIVARWYVVGLGGDSRVVQTISIASPFRGTRHARLLPAGALRDIEPSSRLLDRLRERELAGRQWPPHLSVVAASDRLVTESEVHSPGDVIVLDDYGHLGVLYSGELGPLIRARILGPCGRPARAWGSAAASRSTVNVPASARASSG